MFNSPNTAAMMGTVPANRRGIAAGARMMLQNTGAVLSIAFVLAIVTAAVPKDVLFEIFSGVATGLSRRAARARSSTTCTPRCGCWPRRRWSAPCVSLLRPATQCRAERGARVTAATPLRIGEVAERARHHAAHDPLLRGDRAPARARASARPAATALYDEARRRAAARRAAPQGAARPQPRRAQGAARGRGGPRRAARRVARSATRAPSRRREILERVARPHRPPARARAPPPRRDRRARGRARGQAPPRDARGCASWATSRHTTACPRLPAPLRARRARSRLPGHGGDPRDGPRRPSTRGSRRRAPGRFRGRRGARTSASASGARCARTTATDGDAWNYFTHDQARSRAYRWGEDGIAGICDERQRLCLALALWNGADPILKERMFGLTNSEGNHGEDVKEYWFYLDSTPTHSYLKCLYKYPQRAFPYDDLVATNARRGKQDMEYELLDTGIFDDDRYFDVVVEYAKAAPRRHPDARHRAQPRSGRGDAAPAADAVVPQHVVVGRRGREAGAGGRGRRRRSRARAHPELGEWRLRADASARAAVLRERDQQRAAVRRARTRRRTSRTRSTTSSSAATPTRSTRRARARRSPPTTCSRSRRASSATVRVRLTARRDARRPTRRSAPDFDRVLEARRDEADAFYATVIPATLDADEALVMRQALAGLLWGKQYYEYDVHRWLREHGVNPWDPNAPASSRAQRPVVPHGRRRHHLDAGQVGVPVVRRLGPGLPLRAAVARRRRLRQGAGRAAARARATCTRTGRSRPTSGTSATSTRR